MPGPIGVPPQSGKIHKKIYSLYQGDMFRMLTSACLDDGTPATPENSRLCFTLVDDRFYQGDCSTFFRAEWGNRIVKINEVGGIEISIPQSITSTLRRGIFKGSLTRSDLLGQDRKTIDEIAIIVEYAADAPNPETTYRGLQESQNHPEGTSL